MRPSPSSSFLYQALSETILEIALSGVKKKKKSKKKPKEHVGLLFHFYCRPSFLSLFLHQALGETILEIPISSAKNPKKIVNQKSKKSTQAYFSVPISVPGSYLHFFIRRWARQFSKYPYLAPKIPKKNHKLKIKKRARRHIFLLFVLGSYLHFFIGR